MSWVKLDDQFFAHPKVIDLGKDAKLLFLAGLAHCAAQLTDGLITPGALRATAAVVDVDRSEAAALVAAGLWHPVDGGGYRVHNYCDYNPSADEVKAERAKNAARQAAWKARRSGGQTPSDTPGPADSNATNASYNGVTDGVSIAVSNTVSDSVADGCPVPVPVPVPPSSPDTETHAETEGAEAAPEEAESPPAAGKTTRKATGVKTQLPVGFTVSDSVRTWAAQRFPGVDVGALLEPFSDHHRANGSRMADWDAALRTWVQNAVRYAERDRNRGGYGGQSPAPPRASASPVPNSPVPTSGGMPIWRDRRVPMIGVKTTVPVPGYYCIDGNFYLPNPDNPAIGDPIPGKPSDMAAQAASTMAATSGGAPR